MQNGYIKIWRKIKNSAVFADPILLKLWILCLCKANHKQTWTTIDGIAKPIELQPGQFITGRFSLHKEFYPKKRKNQKSPLTLWRKLEILQNLENLNIKSYSKYSIVSITNWNTYQGNEQHVNNTRTTREQHVNTDKNVKNEKNGNSAFSENAVPENPFYLTKKKKKLTGWKYEKFAEFWETFAWKRGKAEAADAWLEIPNLDGPLVEKIISAAKAESKRRFSMMKDGGKPKWAEGWLRGRRWEDEHTNIIAISDEQRRPSSRKLR